MLVIQTISLRNGFNLIFEGQRSLLQPSLLSPVMKVLIKSFLFLLNQSFFERHLCTVVILVSDELVSEKVCTVLDRLLVEHDYVVLTFSLFKAQAIIDLV